MYKILSFTKYKIFVIMTAKGVLLPVVREKIWLFYSLSQILLNRRVKIAQKGAKRDEKYY